MTFPTRQKVRNKDGSETEFDVEYQGPKNETEKAAASGASPKHPKAKTPKKKANTVAKKAVRTAKKKTVKKKTTAKT